MTSLYTKFVASALFPLQELLKGHSTVAVRRAMEESQWWSADRLLEHQTARLRDFLTDIGARVPYYRELFRAIDFAPEDLRSTGDLAKLPFLTKSIIRANAEELKAVNATGLARFNTGGSSGEPLIFFVGNERVSHDVAAKWRATRWWGVDIGDKETVVWGSPIELGAQDRVRILRDRLMRTELLSAFEMSENRLDEFVERIRQRRPRMLFGYPSSLSLIARHAERRGIAMDSLGVEVAFVTSERLYEDQREAIGRIFGCRVANGYGGRDAGFIAHECPGGSIHITAEDIIVEIVDQDGKVVPPGRSGEIVITHLATRDFPFVRYRTGDVGVLSGARCVCGRGLPALADIQGRTTDFVVAADGTVMHGLALIYVLRDLPGVGAFKITQENVDLTRVQVVATSEFDESTVMAIQSGLKARLGKGVKIVVETADDIAPEKSGKFRYVVSHVEAQS